MHEYEKWTLMDDKIMAIFEGFFYEWYGWLPNFSTTNQLCNEFKRYLKMLIAMFSVYIPTLCSHQCF